MISFLFVFLKYRIMLTYLPHNGVLTVRGRSSPSVRWRTDGTSY